METISFWWKVIIWHPLDIADKILVLVGAVAGFLYDGGTPLTVDLAWQIPLGVIIVLFIWRLMQAPVKIINRIRMEREGKKPITLEDVGKQIEQIEINIKNIQGKIEPQHKFDTQDIKQKILLDYKSFDDSSIGGITRFVVFVLEITNASPVWINTTGNIKGDLIVLAWRLGGVPWQVNCNGIEPGKKGSLSIIFPVSENFARTLAFKPKTGSFSAEFSEMLIEFEAMDGQERYTLGYIPIGGRYDIPIKDHPSYQKIRKIVEWEEQLGIDDRIIS